MNTFTPEELDLISKHDTPEAVQAFLDTLAYNFEPDGVPTLKSFRRVLRDRTAHCMEGALSAAAILKQHGYPPQILCMEARDIDHIVFVYQKDALWGAVAQSRDSNLKFRPPVFADFRELVMSYHPHYWNYFTGDLNDLTLRGFAHLPLDRIQSNWITNEDNCFAVEDKLYESEYEALFPEDGHNRFRSNRDGTITWIS